MLNMYVYIYIYMYYTYPYFMGGSTLVASAKEAILLGWYLTYGLLWIIPAALMTVVCWDTVFQPGAQGPSIARCSSWGILVV